MFICMIVSTTVIIFFVVLFGTYITANDNKCFSIRIYDAFHKYFKYTIFFAVICFLRHLYNCFSFRLPHLHLQTLLPHHWQTDRYKGKATWPVAMGHSEIHTWLFSCHVFFSRSSDYTLKYVSWCVACAYLCRAKGFGLGVALYVPCCGQTGPPEHHRPISVISRWLWLSGGSSE